MSDAEKVAKLALKQMIIDLDYQIAPKTEEYRRFLVAAEEHVGRAAISKSRCKTVMDMLKSLETKDHLNIHNFGTLRHIMTMAHLEKFIEEIVNKTARDIQEILCNPKVESVPPQQNSPAEQRGAENTHTDVTDYQMEGEDDLNLID